MDLNGLNANSDQIAKFLSEGRLVVLRTDTLYGIVARADDAEAVRRLQRVRHREPGKAFIVLLAEPSEAYGSDAEKVIAAYDSIMPTRPTSVVIENSTAPEHLLHKDRSLAYRVPQLAVLRELLRKTGPLVAPSANLAGETPAQSVAEAKAYFGDAVACYVDDGSTPDNQQASSVIMVEKDGTRRKLR